jgi:hypothetical protein
MVSLVQGTNIIRKEHGIPEAECIAANPDLTMLDVRKSAPAAAAAAPAAKKSGASKKKTKKK